MTAIIMEMVKKAFLKEDLKTVNSLWGMMEPSDKIKIQSFIKKMPKDISNVLIKKIKIINEYIAGEIQRMVEEPEINENEDEMKMKIKDTEYTIEEIVTKCQEDEEFILDVMNAFVENFDPEKIPEIITRIITLDPSLAAAIQKVLLSVNPKLESEFKESDLKESDLKDKIEKLNKIYASPEDFLNGINDPVIRKVIYEKIVENIPKILYGGNKFIITLLKEYETLYLQAEEMRIESVKSKAKVLGEFKKALVANHITDINIHEELLSVELKRLNKRLQMI